MFANVEQLRRYCLAIIVAGTIVFLLFMSLVAWNDPPQMPLRATPSENGLQLLTWVMPGSEFWNAGLRPGYLVRPIPSSVDSSVLMVFEVAEGGERASARRILSIARPRQPSLDVVLIGLGLEFLTVGVLVFLLATDRPAARRLFALAGIFATTMVVIPAVSAQIPWAQYLEWVTNDTGVAAFAIVFLSTPVPRWRRFQQIIIFSFVPLLAIYSYAVLADPLVYDLVRPLSFAYMAICMVAGVTGLAWPFITRSPVEERRLWPVAVSSGLATILFVGGSLLPFIFFQRYLVPPSVAILAWGLLPLSIMWALLRHRFMGVTLGKWRLFRTMLDTITDAVFVVGSDGRPVYVNKGGWQMLGTMPDYHTNTPFDRTAERWRVRDTENTLSTTALLRGVFNGETFRDEEQLVRMPDGRVSCVSIAGVPVFNKRGQVDMSVLVYRDITERKRMEEELRRSHEGLELRIRERTAELSRTNEEMRIEIAERKQAEEQLEMTRARLEHILASCPAIIYGLKIESVSGSGFAATFISRNIKDMFGYEVAECLADPSFWVNHIHPADRSLAIRRQDTLREYGHLDHEYRFQHKDGTYRWVHDTLRLLRDADGEPLEISGSWMDITAKKQAEERIQREATRTKALLGIASRLSTELSLDTLLAAVCEEAAQALGVQGASVTLCNPENQVFALAASYGLQADLWAKFKPIPCSLIYEQAQESGFVIQLDAQAVFSLPNEGPVAGHNVSTTVAGMVVKNSELVGTINVHTLDEPRSFDEDELCLLTGLANVAGQAVVNVGLFEEVTRQREQLRAMYARLAEVEEAERRRLATELHDQVGQSLTALGINLNILRQQLPRVSEDMFRTRLDDSVALVEEIARLVRNVMASLRPSVLDDLGLPAALRWHGALVSSRTGIDVVVFAEDIVPRPPSRTESTLFRIAQECLINVAKHASAKRVTVTVGAAGGSLRLVVVDDGVGFEPGSPTKLDGQRGWGLIAIKERVDTLGGSFCLKSSPGLGTIISVEVPL